MKPKSKSQQKRLAAQRKPRKEFKVPARILAEAQKTVDDYMAEQKA